MCSYFFAKQVYYLWAFLIFFLPNNYFDVSISTVDDGDRKYYNYVLKKIHCTSQIYFFVLHIFLFTFGAVLIRSDKKRGNGFFPTKEASEKRGDFLVCWSV